MHPAFAAIGEGSTAEPQHLRTDWVETVRADEAMHMAALLEPLASEVRCRQWSSDTLRGLAEATCVVADIRYLVQPVDEQSFSVVDNSLPFVSAAGRAIRRSLVQVLDAAKGAASSDDVGATWRPKAEKQSRRVARQSGVVGACSGPAKTASGVHEATHERDKLNVGLLSFGYSGGCRPGTGVVLAQSWANACMPMECLGVDCWFAPGCRREPGTNIRSAVPDLNYVVTGHESAAYDAVAFFHRAGLEDIVVWERSASRTSRTCWVTSVGAEM